jgi:hypothetical protein
MPMVPNRPERAPGREFGPSRRRTAAVGSAILPGSGDGTMTLVRAAALAAMGTMLAAGGCEASRDAGVQVQREAGVMAEKTRAGAADMVAAAGERTVVAAGAAADWAGELVRSGQLSDTARSWLRSGAAASQQGIEAVLQRGEQAVPVAMEIGKALTSAVDSDTMFEPIYQEVSGGSPELALRRSEADTAIQGMTRVEVIDGVQVGFKELSSLDLGHRVTEQAYLVVWRQDDRLVGFVYRSRRDIDLGQLVALAPRLIGLVRSAL